MEERQKVYFREFQWNFGIPLAQAADWHCKYRVIANQLILGNSKPEEKIKLDITMQGFENYMYVILQPKGQFNDVWKNQSTKARQAIYKAEHGARFMIPTDYDVLISFAPVSNNNGIEKTSINGGVSLRAELVDKVKLTDRTQEMAMYTTFVNVLRPGEIDIFPVIDRNDLQDGKYNPTPETETDIAPESNNTNPDEV